jgi:hypothetical protein
MFSKMYQSQLEVNDYPMSLAGGTPLAKSLQ